MLRNFSLAMIIITTVLVCSTSLADTVRPVWTASRITNIPNVTSLAKGGDWSEASSFSGLTCFGTALMSSNQPIFWVGYDDTRLYVAFRVPRNGAFPFLAATTNRDGGVWNDDAVEVFLDPNQTRSTYYQLIVAANGAIYDAKGRESGWNGNWTIKSAEGDSAWAAICSIPFSELGASKPQISSKWGLNLAVDRTINQRPSNGLISEEQLIAWSLTASTLHEPKSFGTLVFGNDKPFKLALQPEKHWKAIKIPSGIVQSPTFMNITDSQGKTVDNYSLQPGNPLDITTKQLDPGKYGLTISTGLAGSESGLLKSSFQVIEGFESQISYLFTNKQILVKVANSDSSRNIDSIKADICNAQGNVITSLVIDIDPQTGRGNAKSKSIELKAGIYTVVFKNDKTGVKLTDRKWNYPGNPKWLGTTAGKIDDNWLPKPWTPVRVKTGKSLSVGVWGRDYRFGKIGLLDSVISTGNELLAESMSLVANTDGTKLVWYQNECKVTSKGQGAVSFASTSEAKGIKVMCKAKAEFDGFIQLDFSISSTKPDASLDNLVFDIPFKRQFATLFHSFPRHTVWAGVDMNDFNAGLAPNKYWSSFFLPHIWLGNEEKGLQWLCESAKGWRPADPNKAIEIIPESSKTTLRLNVIGKNTRIGNGLKYTFMFQASPIKPMSSERYYMGYSHVGGYGMEKQPYGPQNTSAVTYPLKGNFDFAKGTVEITVTPNFDSMDPASRNADLFYVQWPADKRLEPDNLICLYWNQDDKGMREVTRDRGVYTRTNGAQFPWKPGEVHTVALVWGGNADGVYVDGKLESAGMPGALLSNLPIEGGVITLGGPFTNFNVRQIKISSVPKSAEQLGKGNEILMADDTTLLLDRFDSIKMQGKNKISTPIKSADSKPGLIAKYAKMEPAGLRLKDVDGTSTYTQLDHQRDIGTKVIGYHEYWTDYEGDTSTTHVKELKSLTDAIHKNKMNLVLYTSWMIADINPEYSLYGEECMDLARNMFVYTREPKQTDYVLCANSIWHDRVIDGISDMFKKYHPDGIYTDGLTYPGDCTNELHGCGFVDDNGERQPTQNILSIRNTMKRVYRIMEKQGKKTYWVAHSSGSITLPTLGFVDAYLDGEHLTALPRPFQLPLDFFRAEFMGHNFGIPALFLVYNWGAGMIDSEGFAISLLHDTELGWDQNYTVKMWKLWKDFRPEKARFMPYWVPANFTAPDNVKVSYYVKPKGDAIIIAVNTGKMDISGSVGVIGKIVSAKDAFDGSGVVVESGQITDTFLPWKAKVYRAIVAKR